MLERALRRLPPVLVPAAMAAVYEAGEQPRASEASLVLRLLEDPDPLGGRVEQMAGISGGLPPQADVLQLDSRAALDAQIVCVSRSSDRLGERVSGRVWLVRCDEHEPELAQQLAATSVLARKRDNRSFEESGRRWDVASLHGAHARSAESAARTLGKRSRVRVEAIQLCAKSICLLEVVAHELVALDRRRNRALEARCEFLVEIGAKPLRRRSVNDLLHQDVTEAVKAVGAHSDEATSGQGGEVKSHSVRGIRFEQ